MSSSAPVLFTLVQHSAFAVAGNPQFVAGVEPVYVTVTKRKASWIAARGGVLLDSYGAAEILAELEMYHGVEGLIPRVRGTFSDRLVDDAACEEFGCLYAPTPMGVMFASLWPSWSGRPEELANTVALLCEEDIPTTTLPPYPTRAHLGYVT